MKIQRIDKSALFNNQVNFDISSMFGVTEVQGFLFPVHERSLLELKENIPHPGPVLLVVDHLGVEVAIPTNPLPLCPRLQTIHIRQECFFCCAVFFLRQLQLFLIVFVKTFQFLLCLLPELFLLPVFLLILRPDNLLLLLPPLSQAIWFLPGLSWVHSECLERSSFFNLKQ